MIQINIKPWTAGLFLIGVVILTSQAVFSFTEPTQTPPLNNVAPPFTPPTGTLMNFNLTSCPSGWTRFSAADGRYMVGSPSNIGSQIGSALGNTENRTVGYHTHGVSDPGHSHGVYDPGHSHSVGVTWVNLTHSTNWYYDTVAWNGGYTGGGWGGSLTANTARTGISLYSAGTGISIQPAGSVSGTNAPYIQVLVCQKN